MSSQQDISTVKTENISDSKQEKLPATTLTTLCIDGKLNEIKTRVESGENIRQTDNEGNFLTHIAARHDKLELLKWLILEKQMDVNQVNLSRFLFYK